MWQQLDASGSVGDDDVLKQKERVSPRERQRGFKPH